MFDLNPDQSPVQTPGKSVYQFQEARVSRDAATIHIVGHITLRSYRRILSVIHEAVLRTGYQDLVLDFARCERVDAAPMLAICSRILALRNDGVSFDLLLPKRASVAQLFLKANWAFLLAPEQFGPCGISYLFPATSFRAAADCQFAQTAAVQMLLATDSWFAQADLGVLFSSLDSMTNNVITHSASAVGGLVQLFIFDRARHIVEFDVCDPGIGIPTTIRRRYPQIVSDEGALAHAIGPDVTSPLPAGREAGISGMYRACAASDSTIHIHSGYANLMYSRKAGLQLFEEQRPYAGTLVAGRLGIARCSRPAVDVSTYEPLEKR